MSKYLPLQRYLEHSDLKSQVAMTFEEIEGVLGHKLPASSRKHRGWWSNNPTNNVMTHAWLNAGYETAEVDLVAERLTFRKRQVAGGQRSLHSKPGDRLLEGAEVVETPGEDDTRTAETGRHPIFGLFRGMIAIEPGYDLTQPTIDQAWLDEKYGG